MLSSRIATGVRVGLIAAAATSGVLIGLGARHEAATIPFLLTGRSVWASFAGALSSPATAIVLGLLIHTAWMIAWGVGFSVVALSLQGPPLLLAAAIFSLVAGILSRTVMPRALGAASLAGLSWPQLAFLLALMALSLAAGMRVARETA